MTPERQHAEKALLYLALLNPARAMSEFLRLNVTRKDFNDPRHMAIFDGLCEMWKHREQEYAAGKNQGRKVLSPFDTTTLEARLKCGGKLALAGGREYLYTLPAVGLDHSLGIAGYINKLRLGREVAP